jgi:hypothetical protein
MYVAASRKPKILTYALFLRDDSNGLDLCKVVQLRQAIS